MTPPSRNTAKYRQRSLDDWPRGLDHPIALLTHEPKDLERRCGVLFSESHDDLDRFLGALIQTVEGKVFALVRHLGAPNTGTEIWVSSASRHPGDDLRIALELLGLQTDSLGWVAPDVSDSAPSSRSGSAT